MLYAPSGRNKKKTNQPNNHNVKGRDYLRYLGVAGKITLTFILAGCGHVDWLGSGYGSIVTSVNTLKMEQVCSSETSVTFCHTIL
jgi:hypothetical protein